MLAQIVRTVSVDGMIVAARPRCWPTRAAAAAVSCRGLVLAGSVANLAASVAVAEPTMTGRVIAAWPPFSLIARMSC
jgi:hypothetical protein